MRAIGLDVHREFCEVAIWEGGEVRSAGRIATKPRGSSCLPKASALVRSRAKNQIHATLMRRAPPPEHSWHPREHSCRCAGSTF